VRRIEEDADAVLARLLVGRWFYLHGRQS
jgi:hypothetical protein